MLHLCYMPCLHVQQWLQHTLISGQFQQRTKSFGDLLACNLHNLVCCLYKQEEVKGYVAKDNELWVECYIQIVKRKVKCRTTAHPEKLYVHDYMRDEAVTAMRHANFTNPCVQKAVNSCDELISKYRADIRSGPLYNTGEAETGTQLIGKGKQLKRDEYDSMSAGACDGMDTVVGFTLLQE